MNENFKKLQAKWYKKLKASGFEDIEDVSSPNELLKTWDSQYFLQRYDPGRFKAKERYFELARQFLQDHVFETTREKDIWAEHAEGRSTREIARRRRIPAGRIRKIIKPLEELMLGRNKIKGNAAE